MFFWACLFLSYLPCRVLFWEVSSLQSCLHTCTVIFISICSYVQWPISTSVSLVLCFGNEKCACVGFIFVLLVILLVKAPVRDEFILYGWLLNTVEGNTRANEGQFRDAVVLFSKAISLDSSDFRPVAVLCDFKQFECFLKVVLTLSLARHKQITLKNAKNINQYVYTLARHYDHERVNRL